jgi:hypothetical protein
MISCQKIVINENSPFDIYFLYFKIFSQNVEMTKVQDGFLIYSKSISLFTFIENNTVNEIVPLASLINQDINLTFKFDKNTLIRNLTVGSEIYCKSNSTKWKGIVISATKFRCLIPFTDHNATTVDFDVVLEVPAISSKDITLSRNTKSLYYLTRSAISFSLENQTKFEYTSTDLIVNLTIKTFIPLSLRNNIYCKFSDSDVQQITYFENSFGNLHHIICNITTPTDGAKNLSLWYKDSYHSFELSSNGLELVFATPKTIYLFSPSAIKKNRTTTLTVSTFFTTQVNYGINEYFCEFKLNSTNTSSTFISPLSVENGAFSCPVIIYDEGKAFMNIWMKSKNIQKKITSKSELFNVVSKNSNF